MCASCSCCSSTSRALCRTRATSGTFLGGITGRSDAARAALLPLLNFARATCTRTRGASITSCGGPAGRSYAPRVSVDVRHVERQQLHTHPVCVWVCVSRYLKGAHTEHQPRVPSWLPTPRAFQRQSPGRHLDLYGYVDADHAADKGDGKSVGGYGGFLLLLNGGFGLPSATQRRGRQLVKQEDQGHLTLVLPSQSQWCAASICGCEVVRRICWTRWATCRPPPPSSPRTTPAQCTPATPTAPCA
mmetsp:Transcript_61002/g.150129  ORF Transcript_61002/g.150129 Transcript_61002/m.150129 type:complete len:245 (-) Transcript_61002:238-972(-)